MPEVIVNLASGRTQEQKDTLLEGIFQVVKDVTGAPDEYIVVSLNETPKENKSRGGVRYDKL